MHELKSIIKEDIRIALRASDKAKLGVLRLVTAAIKQVEVDERRELTDDDVLSVLERMLKQRRESLDHYRKANRSDLADQESYEIGVIKCYMPEPLSTVEITSLIKQTIDDIGASSLRDMGKVMATLKAQIKGRADMRDVSNEVKSRLQ
ncbi:MAG: glutamyl-tRNA amidotransferase [Rhodospirillaceae bacterium]|nr:glutamyl-tRNA amidotransferase [Rhodospirillaceae bacterium]